IGLDAPPCQTLPPGALFRAPVFVAHWDRRRLSAARLRWRVSAIDRFGDACVVNEGQRRVEPRQYSVTDAGAIEARAPDAPCLLTVALWLEDEQGAVRARNYVNVDVSDGSPLPQVERTGRGCALRF